MISAAASLIGAWRVYELRERVTYLGNMLIVYQTGCEAGEAEGTINRKLEKNTD